MALTGGRHINAIGNKNGNIIVGNSGNNILDGGRGNDRLSGGGGNDTFKDFAGDDVFIGGAGADRFYFAATNESDTIVDFTSGVDKLVFTNGVDCSDLSFAKSGECVVISYLAADITLKNTDLVSFRASLNWLSQRNMFIFAKSLNHVLNVGHFWIEFHS